MQKQVKSSLVSEIQLSYKSRVKVSERIKIGCSMDAYEVFKNSWSEDLMEFVEEFKVLLINTAGQVLGIVSISKGGVRGTVCDPKVIFASALKANASSIVVAHNHPSGNLNPSEADLQITRKLKEGGLLLEISVLDHLIITAESYFSFADRGLL